MIQLQLRFNIVIIILIITFFIVNNNNEEKNIEIEINFDNL